MNFRNISAWSIRNPVVPIVLFIGLMLAGIVVPRMEIQADPDIEFPMVIVSDLAARRRADRDRNQITQRVEARCARSAGSSRSSTAREGNSQTMVEFQIGHRHQSRRSTR
jgi:multidrug efflux pump subunit AcrB